MVIENILSLSLSTFCYSTIRSLHSWLSVKDTWTNHINRSNNFFTKTYILFCSYSLVGVSFRLLLSCLFRKCVFFCISFYSANVAKSASKDKNNCGMTFSGAAFTANNDSQCQIVDVTIVAAYFVCIIAPTHSRRCCSQSFRTMYEKGFGPIHIT